jgi:hypothetical protein
LKQFTIPPLLSKKSITKSLEFTRMYV